MDRKYLLDEMLDFNDAMSQPPRRVTRSMTKVATHNVSNHIPPPAADVKLASVEETHAVNLPNPTQPLKPYATELLIKTLTQRVDDLYDALSPVLSL